MTDKTDNMVEPQESDLIRRGDITYKLDALVIAASMHWGSGSQEHNLVRDISDAVAKIPAITAALEE